MFKPGDGVFVHSGKFVEHHIPCCIVQVIGNSTVCVVQKVQEFDGLELRLSEWCQSPMVSLCAVISDSGEVQLYPQQVFFGCS